MVSVLDVKICTNKPTVNKIIEAAVPLFATKGLAAVSVKELADAAGVNIALISYYFGGKDNLYAFVLQNQLSVLEDAFNVMNQEISPVMKIRRFTEMLLVSYKKSPYLNRLFFMEILSPTKYFDTIVKTAAQRLHGYLKGCIIEAIAAGEFRSDIEPEFAAMSMMKIMNLSFTDRQFCHELLPDTEDIVEKYIPQAVEIYLNGVVKQG